MNKPQRVDWKRNVYKSKYDSYDISQRLEDLKNILEIQCSSGNYNTGEYMRGMANGMLLAWYTIAEPYGAEVPFFSSEAVKEVISKETMEAG